MFHPATAKTALMTLILRYVEAQDNSNPSIASTLRSATSAFAQLQTRQVYRLVLGPITRELEIRMRPLGRGAVARLRGRHLVLGTLVQMRCNQQMAG